MEPKRDSKNRKRRDRKKGGAEKLLETIVYNKSFRKTWNKNMNNGTYYRGFKPLVNAVHFLFPTDLKDYKMNFIAQSHLDAAWLWTQRDSIERSYMTFYKAVEHIEKYPFFTFTQTSPQYFAWMKQYAPSLWEKIKKYVAGDRLEIIGGMWVEPDLVMPCGESLVRQRLYGMLFYQLNFGKMPKVESLLDVFGFPQQVAQILAKSGAESFWTTKCTWNDMNFWPFAYYWWEGQDGSRVFTHHFNFNYFTMLNSRPYKKTARFPKQEYIGKTFTSFNTNKEIEESFSDEVYGRLPLFYGYGDGAKGPLEVEIGVMQLFGQLGMGKFCRMEPFFDILQSEIKNRLVVWADEMYLEYHRGCFTSQVNIKKLDRAAELYLITAETLLTILNINLKGQSTQVDKEFYYNKAEFFDAWRKVLFNQFHDIIPGSSIQDVYPQAFKELEEVIEFAKKKIDMCVSLAELIHGKEGRAIVFNPSSFVRAETLAYNTSTIYVKNLNPLSFNEVYTDFVAYKGYPVETEIRGEKCYEIFNSHLKAGIRIKDGALVSLVHLKSGKDIMKVTGRGAGIRVFRDEPKKYPAWNLDFDHLVKPVVVKFDDIKTSGSHVIVENSFLKSKSVIEYYLLPDDDFLRINIKVEMNDKKIVVKYFAPFELQSEFVVSDAPYGTVTRSRVPKSEMQYAKFEITKHQWIDISDEDFGVAFLSKDRYGAFANHLGMGITLVRTPLMPTSPWFPTRLLIPKKDRQKYVDMGSHQFDLALYPHEKTWKEANVVQKAQIYNLPSQIAESKMIVQTQLQAINPVIKENVNKLINPFCTVSCENVFVTAIKPPEWMSGKLVEHEDYVYDGKSIIIRLVEMLGKDCSCELKFNAGFKVKSIVETDMLERKTKEVQLSGQSATLKFVHNEIKTIMVVFE